MRTEEKWLRERVAWRDLTMMRPRDGLVECLHPLSWLLGSWAAADARLWPLAMAASFMFFLTALRLNHEAIHGNLGFDARGHRAVLHGLSVLMLGSNNAVAFNHLRHHRHLGSERDVEGKAGRMTAGEVLRYGPLFPIEMHRMAWRDGGRAVRQRMLIDGAGNLALVGTAAALGSMVLGYHLAAMLAAQALTAFFAVWITHHDLEGDDALVARTQRSPLVNAATYNMLLHLEHHLFPAVPVKRLGRLAARLDAAAPDFARRAKRVLPPVQPRRT